MTYRSPRTEHQQGSLFGLSEDESVTEIQECFTLYETKRARNKHRSRESPESPPTSTLGLVVIFVPTDPGIRMKSFNAIKYTTVLEICNPDG